MRNPRAWLGGALLAIAAVAVVWSCARGSAPKEPASPEPGSAVNTPGTPSDEKLAGSVEGTSPESEQVPAPPANGAVAPSGSPSDPALVGSVGEPRASSAGPGARIAQAVKTSDPRDLEFLSHIERELKRDPPPEVHALIRRRQQGASRDELVAGARALADLPLRVLALRWVDSVLPGPGAATTPVAPQPKPSGHSPVAPITPVR